MGVLPISKSTWWEQLGNGRGEEEEEDEEEDGEEEEEDGGVEGDAAGAAAELLPTPALTERGRFRQWPPHS